MRYRDRNGQDWADIIDFLTMYPGARRQMVRVIGEIDAKREADCPTVEGGEPALDEDGGRSGALQKT
jgi:hypothetical protein